MSYYILCHPLHMGCVIMCHQIYFQSLKMKLSSKSDPYDPVNMRSGISDDVLSMSNLNPLARTFYPRMFQVVTHTSNEKSRMENCPKRMALGLISSHTTGLFPAPFGYNSTQVSDLNPFAKRFSPCKCSILNNTKKKRTMIESSPSPLPHNSSTPILSSNDSNYTCGNDLEGTISLTSRCSDLIFKQVLNLDGEQFINPEGVGIEIGLLSNSVVCLTPPPSLHTFTSNLNPNSEPFMSSKYDTRDSSPPAPDCSTPNMSNFSD